MKPSALTNKNKKEIHAVLGILEDYINQGSSGPKELTIKFNAKPKVLKGTLEAIEYKSYLESILKLEKIFYGDIYL